MADDNNPPPKHREHELEKGRSNQIRQWAGRWTTRTLTGA